MPRFGDFGDGQTDRTDCFTPCCACAHGVISHIQLHMTLYPTQCLESYSPLLLKASLPDRAT